MLKGSSRAHIRPLHMEEVATKLVQMAASEVVASTVAAVGVPGVALVAVAWAGVEVEVAGAAVVVLTLRRAVASKASMASVAGKGMVGFVEQTLAE